MDHEVTGVGACARGGVEPDERPHEKDAERAGNCGTGRNVPEECWHGANRWVGAERLRRHSARLAIAKRDATFWIIVTLGLRKYPRAGSDSDAACNGHRPPRVAKARGSRGGVSGRNKDTA